MFADFRGAFDELGVRLMSLGVGLEQELEDEFEGGFDSLMSCCCVFAYFRGAFDEFGGAFDEFGVWVWNRSLKMSLKVILMSLMSLGVRLLCVCCLSGCV